MATEVRPGVTITTTESIHSSDSDGHSVVIFVEVEQPEDEMAEIGKFIDWLHAEVREVEA